MLWAAETRVPQEDATQDARLRAIEIAPSAFADGVPQRTLRVSRQHRMMVKSRIAERMFGVDEVLIPAKDLLELPGVRAAEADREFRYFHLLLPVHSVLLAEGVAAESLWLGEEATRMLGAGALMHARQSLYAQQQPARPFVSGRRARQLVARHLRNRRDIWEAASPFSMADGRRHGAANRVAETSHAG